MEGEQASTSSPPPLTDRLVARNAVLNVCGGVLQLAVLFVTMPFLVRAMGAPRYGVYSLILILLAYISCFDLGLGRAALKHIAEAIGNNAPARIVAIFRLTVIVVPILGLVTGGLLVLAAPLVVDRLFQIPPAMTGESVRAFQYAALSLVSLFLVSATTCVLNAHQRFDLTMILRVASHVLSAILPLVAVLAGATLGLVMIILAVKNAIIAVILLGFCLRILPRIRGLPVWDAAVARILFSFGGWAHIGNIANLLMGNLERFLLGMILTVTAVTFYTPPQQIVGGLLLLLGCMVKVLFPAFSQMYAQQSDRLPVLFRRAMRFFVLAMSGCAFVLLVSAREIMTLWMGPAFERSAVVLQWLGAVPLMTAVAWLFNILLQSTRYVRTTALIPAAMLIFQLAVSVPLIQRAGLEGAAVAALATQVCLVFLTGIAVRWHGVIRISDLVGFRDVVCLAVLALFAVGILLAKDAFPVPSWLVILLAGASVSLFYLVTYLYAFDPEDRRWLTGLIRRSDRDSDAGRP
jgi:O-antigen/teichoic acid export membrane protein